MFLNKIILIEILNILSIKVISIGSYKTLQTGTFYLNSERPLWILQDQKDESVGVHVKKPVKEKLKFDHIKPLYYQHRQQSTRTENFKIKAQKPLFLNKSYKELQSQRHYIPAKKSMNFVIGDSLRRSKNSKFIQNMPVFDAVPGNEAYIQSTPIFIYAGKKGRMLLNTMLSKKKYLMQEPVPGQILYPPKSIIFKPKPLVENFKQKINVTMIPFYAYEAIDPRFSNSDLTTTTASSLLSDFNSSKKYKKAKQYMVFYSPQEVVAQPVKDYTQHHYNLEYTTTVPFSLENPYNNHRLTLELLTPTTTLPREKFEVTYNDGEDKFQITYEGDTPYLERPINIETTTPASRTNESYRFDHNYYAFPLYTMSKDNHVITENNPERSQKNETLSMEEERKQKYRDLSLKENSDNWQYDTNGDTWFILNSRYKGPLKTSATNLHSSKYVHNSPAKLQDNLL